MKERVTKDMHTPVEWGERIIEVRRGLADRMKQLESLPDEQSQKEADHIRSELADIDSYITAGFARIGDSTRSRIEQWLGRNQYRKE